MTMRKLPLFKVAMNTNVNYSVERTLLSGYIGEGPKSKEFEQAIQKWLDNENVALLNSCTSAITIALRLCDINKDSEIISSPLTCVATNTPILSFGAKIRWADIDPTTGNICPESIRTKITNNTKAIIFPHWAGIPANIDEINKTAKLNNIRVIEDAAHAFGAKYNGEYVGSHSDYVCFSFQAIKHLTSVDGGALATKKRSDYKKCKLLRWYGDERNKNRMDLNWDNDIFDFGYKMHLNDVLATIGLENLKLVDFILLKHQQNAIFIMDNLKDIEEIELPVIKQNVKPSFWVLPIKLPNSIYREKFHNYLQKKGISSSLVHKRNDLYSIFKDFTTNLPNLDDYYSRMICIPCGWWLNETDLVYLIRTINEAVRLI